MDAKLLKIAITQFNNKTKLSFYDARETILS